MQFLASLYTAVFYQPVFNVLILLYNVVPGKDLGVSIILLTALFRVVMLPLSIKAAVTQKKFTELQPRVKEIQEKFKTNKDQQARELLALYQKEKVNPFAGILPLLIQIPILLALFQVFGKGLQAEQISNLYWFVQNPVHLNPMFLGFLDLQARSLWIGVVAAVLQFIQSKQMVPRQSIKSAKQSDFASNLQTSMVYFSPLLTLAILPQLPAAVGLYWITTSVFSIWQQWYITRTPKAQTSLAK
ncbi:MAG: YidC/Oxa1 family membrane protein insertase [bacterium]|nr:YidC/Oxa1 family membrane protein insertase [bacterium]